MELNAGMRLRSTACSTEVIVVRPPITPVDLRCGGEPMVQVGSQPTVASPGGSAGGPGTLLGKRYSGEDSGIELLCTKAGDGSLTLGETPLALKDAKPLPSSD